MLDYAATRAGIERLRARNDRAEATKAEVGEASSEGKQRELPQTYKRVVEVGGGRENLTETVVIGGERRIDC